MTGQGYGLGIGGCKKLCRRGQESDGLVLLVPGVQAGVCFRGTQLGALIRESPG